MTSPFALCFGNAFSVHYAGGYNSPRLHPRYFVQRPLCSVSSRDDITPLKPTPRLILAPMEVLGDRQFRSAISVIGGMDEAVHEFIRIASASPRAIDGVIKHRYSADEMGTTPLAAQIMGDDPAAMSYAAGLLATTYNAPRVDLNCGCPSKRVNGKGAGASMLLDPDRIFDVTRAMVDAVQGKAPVSVKIRSGFEDTALFKENVCAVRDAGARYLTVHPRTRRQAYTGNADWRLIADAKRLCGARTEVVGNGDVVSAEDAHRMIASTGCDHMMVGRGAVANPWIFWEIRSLLLERGLMRRTISTSGKFRNVTKERSYDMEKQFWVRYLNAEGGITDRSSPKQHQFKISRLKMIVRYTQSIDEPAKQKLLRRDGGDARAFLEDILEQTWLHYRTAWGAAESEHTLVPVSPSAQSC